MDFFFGVAAGIAVYKWLFKIMGIDDGVAEATGWMVGIGLIVFMESIKSLFARSSTRDNVLKARVKELESEIRTLEEKDKVAKQKLDGLNFFKEKEM
ncbi:MAG: hypothetical protein H7263_09790 [Candidatus Sericytochromatia bacterium]|nr:hypothetical protein [Candidatus Sericytochromatia bacterium]